MSLDDLHPDHKQMIETLASASIVIFAAHGTSTGTKVSRTDLPTAMGHISVNGTPASLRLTVVSALLASVADVEYFVETFSAWSLPEGVVLAVKLEDDQ